MTYPFKQVFWSMEDGQQVPSSREWLHTGELERLNEFRFDKRKNDYLLGRWTAKKVVHAYLDKAIPLCEIEIRNAESGAPEVYHQNKLTTASISISHTLLSLLGSFHKKSGSKKSAGNTEPEIGYDMLRADVWLD